MVKKGPKMTIDFDGYTGAAMVRGDCLPLRLQRDALAAYLHRFTKEHHPLWARKPRPNGAAYPVQFASDVEWLQRTLFPVTVRKGGRLGNHTRGHAESHPSWPDGLSLEDLRKAGSMVSAVPTWRKA